MNSDQNTRNKNYIILIKSGINVKDNLLALYKSNLGFRIYIIKKCSIPASRYDDCMQLAYLALFDAVSNFKFIYKTSFINYYKKWLIHYFYDDMLKMGYPIKINRSLVNEIGETKWHPIDAISIDIINSKEMYRIEESISLFTIMQKDLKETIWNLIKEDLSEKNFYIIQQRYIHNRTLASIGDELGIGKERVRLRILRALKRLRKNKNLRQIAVDWFDIDVR